MSSPEYPNLMALARAHGGPFGCGCWRGRVEDFEVVEHLGFEPQGAGEHWWLRIEKRDVNTIDVVRELARAADVRPADVGFSGLKDRRAVAVQWFSVPAGGRTAFGWAAGLPASMRVLCGERHGRKLRRGSHRHNAFRIRVRELSADSGALRRGLDAIDRLGFPNYFGEQRFGGGNLRLADRWFEDPGLRLRRQQRSLALSAVRSALFNLVLSDRVTRATWDRLLPGEVANLNGSGSVFAVALPDAAMTRRCEERDLHPTGPLPGLTGRGACVPGADVGRAEARVLHAHPRWIQGLERARVKAGRRALRAVARGLKWSLDDGSLELSFSLERGVFATALLRELLDDPTSGRRDRPGRIGSGS